MGCDIHMHIEVKINGKWEHYGAPNITRNYTMFGMLAGVRNQDVEPISQPKGFPYDASVLTTLEYMEDYGHTPSWLSSEEMAEFSRRWSAYGKSIGGKFQDYDLEHSVLHSYLHGNGFCDHVIYEDGYLPDGIEDTRLVFWFNS